MTLIIFTHSYPYDYAAEHTFISREITYLVERFDQVVLVPKACKGTRLSLPSSVEIDETYAEFLKANLPPGRLIKQVYRSGNLSGEIQKDKKILLYPSKIFKLIMFSGKAGLTRRWMTEWIKTRQVAVGNCILYSYWFDHTATGLGMVKEEFPGIKVISRAHGYDIYDEYYYPYYWPFRRETLEVLDMLFFASEAGREYFCDRYPEYISKYQTAHLGISDPGFVSKPSEDNVFRIVSCSTIVSVKRLGLLLEGLAFMARLRRGQKFEWVHFGDGQGRKSLERKMQQEFPSNIKGNFTGYVPNQEIMRFYRKYPSDVFVNVSETEGGAPVSIQEAISCGIPVVATSVGGNPEIVSAKNGILLGPNPTPEEIAMALLKIWDDPTLAAEMRKESRRVWQTSYNADVNFRNFAERLKSIGES